MRGTYLAQLSVVFFTAISVARERPLLPEWRPIPLAWDELWQKSPDILIGDVRNIHSLGVQKIHKPRSPEWAVGRFIGARGSSTPVW